ncbi:carbohydrate-binding protein [Phytoactinopolyspora alkaliphila]|uniref:Exo-alpha-(1->6)-L-arabinopyranosidase n=2 Tax=Phytoactinopolyspora alkaliphila TaxID=1783498 RepID=A0A6N9YMU3_9ACTN|nr:glycoside hydrolase family 3 protein [Phytoactinopolyspora alkaliphila]NED96240.1 carbohydrate-binding protein [Phytoactinopolyspora alkaliphila]
MAGAQDAELPFKDPDLPLDERVDDLLSRLTLDEKLSLLHQSQEPIPRLGIPYFKAGTEALHGVAWSNDLNDNWDQVLATRATVFPQAVGLASTWNPDLITEVGSAVGDELRAYNSIDPVLWGLQVWAPVVDLLRDPRWGRNEEGYSEDPLLTGAISTAYGKGLSGDDPDHLKVAPVLKHFYGYNNEADRSLTSSNLPPRVKHEYAQAAFKHAIEADAATGVMASYNMVNGRPTHVDPDIDEVVRSWTDKDLYNVSDAWGPRALVELQEYFDDHDEAYAAVLKAGLDGFTVDGSDAGPTTAFLKSALDKGYLSIADVDESVRNVLSVRFRLGHFDPDGGPYGHIGEEALDTPAHRELNRRTAEEALVLLDNAAGTLPLDPDATGSVAVIGPLHDTLFSDWYGGTMPYEVTPLDGIEQRLGGDADVVGVEGIDRLTFRDVETGHYLTATGTGTGDRVVATDDATEASQWDFNEWMADYATLRNAENGRYLTGDGGAYNTSSEEPGGWYVQQQFRLEEQEDGTYVIQYVGYETNEGWWWIPEHYITVAADGTVGTGSKADAARFEADVVNSGIDSAVAASAGADAAVVVVGSQPFVYGREIHDRETLVLGTSQQKLVEAVTAANPNTVVVLETSYPTTMQPQPDTLLWTTHAGSETGNAIAGALFGDVNPAGRLTQTWYSGTDDLPSIFDYDIISAGMTYMYYDGNPLYPFGHGLSYSGFEYSKLKTNGKAVGGDGRIKVSVDVTNTGEHAGDEVVQLYTSQRESRDTVAEKTLREFQRVSLEPGETTTVTFDLRASELARWDVTRDRWVVERSVYDVLVGASSADIRQQATLRVNGEVIPPRDLSKSTRAVNFDDYSGVRLVDESKERGTSVEGDDGAWVKFADARLRQRTTTFTARVASAGSGEGSIEVRLDSPTGPLAGTASVESTGGVYEYTTVSGSVSLPGAAFTRDVYLVFDGDVRLASFTIS